MGKRSPLSDAETDVMKALWAHGPGTVRQVNEILRKQGKRWAYTTVLTLLQRLQAKGCVTSDTAGVAHVFRAAASRDEVLNDRLNDLAQQLCDGTATPLVLALMKGNRFSPEEIARLRRLLDTYNETES
jgi:predicted transcriptional regulator